MSLHAALSSAITYFHLLAAIVWVGGMIFFLFAYGPAARALGGAGRLAALNRGRESFQILSWVAVHLLFLTGVLNFFFRFAPRGPAVGGAYKAILSLKLLLFAAMVFHHALQAFKYAPRLAAELGVAEEWPEPLTAAWKKWFTLLKINAALGVIVLLLGLSLDGR